MVATNNKDGNITAREGTRGHFIQKTPSVGYSKDDAPEMHRGIQFTNASVGRVKEVAASICVGLKSTAIAGREALEFVTQLYMEARESPPFIKTVSKDLMQVIKGLQTEEERRKKLFGVEGPTSSRCSVITLYKISGMHRNGMETGDATALTKLSLSSQKDIFYNRSVFFLVLFDFFFLGGGVGV